eukprot:366295-Chlamydomonas_euryale.AAC.3
MPVRNAMQGLLMPGADRPCPGPTSLLPGMQPAFETRKGRKDAHWEHGTQRSNTPKPRTPTVAPCSPHAQASSTSPIAPCPPRKLNISTRQRD